MLEFIKWEIPVPDQITYDLLAKKVTILGERLHFINEHYPNSKLASSLAVEDMVLTDLIAQLNLAIGIFTLETAKLHPQTLALIPQIKAKYNIDIETYRPDTKDALEYEQQYGGFAFYESVELRKKCCFFRKIKPLERALNSVDAWLTGQRKEQSITRTELQFEEQDNNRQIAKFNPIFDWTETDVWAYILSREVPYNTLYQQGYPSIGCEPCTKPIRKGEDLRAGRWWWEQKDSKECGLHK